jgi:hypothetical protein
MQCDRLRFSCFGGGSSPGGASEPKVEQTRSHLPVIGARKHSREMGRFEGHR